MEIVRYHSVRDVGIVAVKCKIEGLSNFNVCCYECHEILLGSFLRELSSTASLLHIEEHCNPSKESSMVFGRDWEFWSSFSTKLLGSGMVSVTVKRGATFEKYEDPVFEFMSLFDGINNCC